MYIMSNDDVTTPSQDFDGTTRYFGRVKWFNNKAGYGFVTIVGEGPRTGEDVFVHHSGVQTGSEQYKYLVQGEYVSFSLRESDSDSHPYQAGEIKGVCDGKLMCETRWENRQAREAQNEENGEDGEYRQRHQPQHNRPRGGGPREDGATWMLVRTDERSGGSRRPPRNTRRPREPRD